MIYGFGENAHRQFKHDLSKYTTWGMYSRDQAPNVFSPNNEDLYGKNFIFNLYLNMIMYNKLIFKILFFYHKICKNLKLLYSVLFYVMTNIFNYFLNLLIFEGMSKNSLEIPDKLLMSKYLFFQKTILH